MARCNLSDDAGCYLANGIQPHGMSVGRISHFTGCHTLILHHNLLGDEAAKAFSDSLSKSNLGLKDLDLSFNKFTSSGGDCLARALSHNSSLTDLNLSHNRFSSLTGKLMLKHMA